MFIVGTENEGNMYNQNTLNDQIGFEIVQYFGIRATMFIKQLDWWGIPQMKVSPHKFNGNAWLWAEGETDLDDTPIFLFGYILVVYKVFIFYR